MMLVKKSIIKNYDKHVKLKRQIKTSIRGATLP